MSVQHRVEERTVSAFTADRFRTRWPGRGTRHATMSERAPRDVGAGTVAVIAAIVAISSVVAVLVVGSIEVIGASEADMPRVAGHLLKGSTFAILVALVAGKLWDRERSSSKGDGDHDDVTRSQGSGWRR